MERPQQHFNKILKYFGEYFSSLICLTANYSIFKGIKITKEFFEKRAFGIKASLGDFLIFLQLPLSGDMIFRLQVRQIRVLNSPKALIRNTYFLSLTRSTTCSRQERTRYSSSLANKFALRNTSLKQAVMICIQDHQRPIMLIMIKRRLKKNTNVRSKKFMPKTTQLQMDSIRVMIILSSMLWTIMSKK